MIKCTRCGFSCFFFVVIVICKKDCLGLSLDDLNINENKKKTRFECYFIFYAYVHSLSESWDKSEMKFRSSEIVYLILTGSF